MGKVFEDYLSEIQKDMLSVCLEYDKRTYRQYLVLWSTG